MFHNCSNLCCKISLQMDRNLTDSSRDFGEADLRMNQQRGLRNLRGLSQGKEDPQALWNKLI